MSAGTGEVRITADITVEAYDKICRDIREQPKWRHDSDVDCGYYDGSQLRQEVIQRLKDAGIPPQDSNLIKPTINAVLGLEARSRVDYKVTSDDESQAEIAEGLSARIKEVETESRADRAMSDAYSSMIRAGIGWVEVSREFDPLRYPYRVREVHRNDIHWDWTAREPDLSDARYLRRDKWVDRVQAMQMFPEQSDLIQNTWTGWNQIDVYDGQDCGMARAYEVEQTWGRNQEDYLNRNSGMARLSELWYRHYEDGYVLALPNGKIIEYREDNPYHQAAVAQGLVQVQKSLLPKVRVSIWLGPHKLTDMPSPLPHTDFPYVPFWCFRKDRSRAPYGLIRDMRGPQDQVIDLDILLYEVLNSVKVEVDNDALDLSQNTYQEVANNISSLRSMTVLNAQRRNADGFKVTREHQLAAQVFQLMQERKRRIEEVGGIYRAMLGADTSATSGVAINSLVEQGSTVLAEPNDNFRYARRLVGQQLLAFIKQDMLTNETAVAVKQGAKRKIIHFNRHAVTDAGPVVENDIATAHVKVVLEDIPATPSFRAQQLQAFTQIVSAAPPQYQAVLYPAMLELSDVPNRHELADQLRRVSGIDGEYKPDQIVREEMRTSG
ncbi:MAG TPA: phage portal protein [Nitrosospira sp.]